MSASEINKIGVTSLFVAALRAAESARPDRLADDPHAAAFLAATGLSAIPGDPDGFVAIMGDQVAVRTRFLDDALLAATAESRSGGGCRQVVLLASGMDSRGYRLPWPAGTELFELDQPAVLDFKQQVLTGTGTSASCTVHQVGVDLRDDWPAALHGAGFRADQPTAWLAEGLLYALDASSADTLLRTVGEHSAPGSTIAFDHIEKGAALDAALRAMDPGLVELWRGGPADPVAWLTGAGWDPDVVDLASVQRRFGRPVHPGYDPARPGSAGSWLGTGRRA